MTKIEDSIEINAPIEDVFTLASDWRRWHEWFVGVSGVRPITEIELGNGARYEYKVRLMGLKAKVQTEIHDFAENLGWRGVGKGGVPHRTTWIFEDRASKTGFTYILEYKLPVPILGALLDVLFVRREWRRIIQKSLLNLRQCF